MAGGGGRARPQKPAAVCPRRAGTVPHPHFMLHIAATAAIQACPRPPSLLTRATLRPSLLPLVRLAAAQASAGELHPPPAAPHVCAAAVGEEDELWGAGGYPAPARVLPACARWRGVLGLTRSWLPGRPCCSPSCLPARQASPFSSTLKKKLQLHLAAGKGGDARQGGPAPQLLLKRRGRAAYAEGGGDVAALGGE